MLQLLLLLLECFLAQPQALALLGGTGHLLGQLLFLARRTRLGFKADTTPRGSPKSPRWGNHDPLALTRS